jgi:methionine aminopeptidase
LYIVLLRRLILVDYGGFHGDLNATYPVGKVDQESADLMATTKAATDAAIAICKPGLAFREVGNKIEEVVKPKGYGIVRRYTGHGIHNLVSRGVFERWRSSDGPWFQNQRGMGRRK